MEIKKPESVEECVYFTNRALENEGFAIAWVYRKICPSCKEGRLGKPIKKNGKPDKKSPNYECIKCKFQESNEDTEKDLQVEVEYKCPHCGNEGEAITEYRRKTFEGVPSFIFTCEKCDQKIGISKKMKKSKKKK